MHAARIVAASACFAAIAMSQDPSTRLDVRKIVLYKHGVGYFERQGTVKGSADVALSFKAAQMKDVLKSLFAVDLGGGRISTVLYDSKDPIQKQLEDILFRVPEDSALTKFLAQLKGARVKASVGSRQVEGSVLGIEPVQRQVQDAVLVTHKLVLLRSDGAIETLDVLDASQVEILDETVRRDLGRMLDIFAKARYADRKVVSLRAEGDGERQVRVGYIMETPIWKTSYRLLLEEGAPARLQGWAIVENRTDEDWRDVQLSFVAGSPISFVLDLYTSYYPQRPVLSAGLGAAEPMTGGLAVPSAPAPALKARRGRAVRKEEAAEGADEAPMAAAAAPEPSLGDLLESSIQPMAQGAAVGDLFEYAAKGPVSIKQGQAALVPILFEKLERSERCLYWRQDLSAHPANAIWLDNTTTLTLEKGPVTVFESSTCLGEAMLARTLKQGQREMLPYAFETAVEVEPVPQSRAQPVTRGVLANGILTMTYVQLQETRYKLRSKTTKAHVLYLDHAKTFGYRLVEPSKPAEELPAHYRFRAEVAAGAESALLVREEQQVASTVSIANEGTERIRFYAQQTWLSAKAKAMLEQVAALLEQRTALDRDTRAAEEEAKRLAEDQENVRRNVSVLRDSPQERALRDQYVERLTKAMQRTDELRAKVTQAQQQRAELDRRIAAELSAFRE